MKTLGSRRGTQPRRGECSNPIVRLDRLEAPYKPPEKVLAAAELGLEELNRYTAQSLVDEFRQLVARVNRVEVDEVVVAPSRAMAAEAVPRLLLKKRKRLLRIAVPSPGLQELRHIVDYYGEPLGIIVERSGDAWRTSPSQVHRVVEEADLVIIDNPSDPTGALLLQSPGEAHGVVEQACRRDAVVVVDESFYEFSGVSLVDMLTEYPCLVVMRSMEQAYALAGLGLAYLLASPSLARELSASIQYPSRTSLLAGIAALESQDYYLSMVEKLVAERERVRQLLLGIEGVTAYRSWTSFLLVETPVDRVVEKLCRRGVAVAGAQPGDRFLRLSIGSQGDNNTFLAALTRLIEEEARLS